MTTPRIWAFGDSITAGTWLANPSAESWPARLDAMLGGGQIFNLGVGGQAIAYADPGGMRMDDHVKSSVLAHPNDGPQIIIFAGGINDMIRNGDISNTRWAVYDLANWAESRGIKFYVHTITPYASTATYAETLSGRRAEYNTWVRAMYGPSNRIIDVGDLLTAGPTYVDARYYLDHLHPNAAGAKIYAEGVYNQLKIKGIC